VTPSAIHKTYAETEPDVCEERIALIVDGDRAFKPNLRAAEARLRGGGRIWVYEVGWELLVLDGGLGAAHGLEVPFVFAGWDSSMATFLVGEHAPPS
jgi:para-nitrobenzyl esterase